MFGLKFWAFIVGAAPLGSALEDYWKRLGFVVIQGYGLTETAPIVTMNHPFKTNTGSVGKPIAGRRSEDRRGRRDSGPRRERHDRVLRADASTPRAPRATARQPADDSRGGWLHTGDIGEQDAEGRLFIRGRKKEMIVTPEGLNVFPDDVERPLNAQKGVIESAVVAARAAEGAEGSERVHAVLVLDPGIDAETVVRDANQQLADHQRIRSFSIWTDGRAAAHGRHEETQARGDQAVGCDRAQRRRQRRSGRRSVAGAAREVCGRARSSTATRRSKGSG